MSEELMLLADVVAALRSELREAQAAGGKDDPRFAVGAVRVEFMTVARREHEGKGGVRFYVFQLGGSAKRGAEETQKVTLTLTPTDREGQSFIVGDTLVVKPD